MLSSSKAVPHTMLRASSSATLVPHTMLSQSARPHSVPHTILSHSTAPPAVPQTMLSHSLAAHDVPQTMLVADGVFVAPQTMFWAHADPPGLMTPLFTRRLPQTIVLPHDLLCG